MTASTQSSVPGRLDDKQLVFDHALAHALFMRKRETPEAVSDWSIVDLVDYHSLLVSEIGHRGMLHEVKDDLDGIPVNAVTVQGLRNSAEQIAAKSLYLPAPAAERIWKGEKTLIVKGRSYTGMLNKALYYGDVNYIYGVIKLTDVHTITDNDFQKSIGKHCLTMDERKKFWPENTVLYAYAFQILCKFDVPLEYEYPRGVKVFFPTPKWVNNSSELTIAVNIDTAVAKRDTSLSLPESYLKAEVAPGVRETLHEISKAGTLILFTDRDSRYYEMTVNWIHKNEIPHAAFIVGKIPADIILADTSTFEPTVLQDIAFQKSFIKKYSSDAADFPGNFFPGRTSEGVMTNVYSPESAPASLEHMANVDNYDPHKLSSLTLMEDHITVHQWWNATKQGQPFRFDRATIKELHDAIVRELDSRGLPLHKSEIMKSGGYSLAPGGIIGVNNMGGGELLPPSLEQNMKEPSPLQYGYAPEKKPAEKEGFFWPGHRKDPKTGNVLPSDRPPVNPMRKQDDWNIRFLGTAGSHETENRHNSSIIFQESGTDILVDLGSQIVVDKIMTKLEAAVITHGHPDHTAALPLLDPAVPIYMHRETWRDLLMHLPEIADKIKDREIILVDTQNPIAIGVCHVVWLPVEHHEEFKTYAISFQEDVLYSPDFSSLPDDYLKNIGTWIIDGNVMMKDEEPTPAAGVTIVDGPQLHSGHQSVLTSLKQAQRMKVPRVVVTHFSVQNDKISQENLPTLLANLALQAGYTGDVLGAGDGFVLPGGLQG